MKKKGYKTFEEFLRAEILNEKFYAIAKRNIKKNLYVLKVLASR